MENIEYNEVRWQPFPKRYHVRERDHIMTQYRQVQIESDEFDFLKLVLEVEREKQSITLVRGTLPVAVLSSVDEHYLPSEKYFNPDSEEDRKAFSKFYRSNVFQKLRQFEDMQLKKHRDFIWHDDHIELNLRGFESAEGIVQKQSPQDLLDRNAALEEINRQRTLDIELIHDLQRKLCKPMTDIDDLIYMGSKSRYALLKLLDNELTTRRNPNIQP